MLVFINLTTALEKKTTFWYFINSLHIHILQKISFIFFTFAHRILYTNIIL